MGGRHRRVCEICGGPMELGERARLLGQREHRPAKFTENGYAIYGHAECMDALIEIIGRLKRERR